MKRLWGALLSTVLALGPGLSPALANKGARSTPKPAPTPIIAPVVNGGVRVPGQLVVPGNVGGVELPKLPPSVIPGASAIAQASRQTPGAQAAFQGVQPAKFPVASASVSPSANPAATGKAVVGAMPQLQAAGAMAAKTAADGAQAGELPLAEAKALFDGSALSENGDLPNYSAPVYFTEDFKDSVEALEKRHGKERWDESHWNHLKSEVNNYLAGGPTTAVLAKRGQAREAEVWKFKWGVHRIFFHPAPDRLSLVLLEAKAKSDLVRTGEGAYYEELGARVRALKADPAEAVVNQRRHESLIARLGRRLAAGGLGATAGAASVPAPMTAASAADEAETARVLEAPLLGSYEAPRALLGARAFYRHLSWASWGGSGIALGAALGLPLALLAATGIAAGTAFSFLIGRDIPVERATLPRARQERLMKRAGDILGDLLVREGQGRAVGLSLARFKIARGALMGFDGKSFHMVVDERWEDAPASQLAGVMAHELGHTLPENAPVFPVSRVQAARLEWIGVAAIALATTLKLFVPWLGGDLSGVDFSHLSAGQEWTIGLAALAAVLWTAGLAFAMAAMRQVEFVADHYGAWASKPRWLADFFRELAGRRSLKDRLLRHLDWRHSHPTDGDRIRRLER